MTTLKDLATQLCDEINKRNDCFQTIHIVFPSPKIEQWFKAFWLNTQDEKVLMNVSFESLDSILPFLVEQPHYRLISANSLRQLIINILSNKTINIIPDYSNYFDNNPVKLFDFASNLASLYLEYYRDDFEIPVPAANSTDKEKFQYNLYQEILVECKTLGIGTLEKPIARKNPVYNDPIYFFGFYKFEKVYERLVQQCGFIKVFALTIDNNFKPQYDIATAPSKLKEVEHVHSEICKLLHSGARAYDIVVVAPNLSEYVTTIERVFKQDELVNKKGMVAFPNIPYVINYYQNKDTDVVSALKILFRAFKDQYYTRLDLFELISNPSIKEVRDISDDDIDIWMRIICNLNIHREHPYCDDWEYLKTRLLLSKFSSVNFAGNNIVHLSDGPYLPFDSISLDDESLLKLVNIINDIKSFTNFLNGKNSIEINDAFIKDFTELLNQWFLTDDIESPTFRAYRKILSSFDSLKKIKAKNISLEVLFFVLFADGAVSSTQRGKSFIDGVTFVDYDINSIVSAKYVFLLGASSNNIPRINIKNELDLRSNNPTNDDAFIFSCLKQNALEHLYISFVNSNLKTDEKFFISPIISSFNKPAKTFLEITIDETRDYQDLFTRKEFKDKEYFDGLCNPSQNNVSTTKKAAATPIAYKQQIREVVTVSQMKDYLVEPLMYKTSRLFTIENDVGEEIVEEYEALALNTLENFNLVNKILLDKLSSNYNSQALLDEFRLSHLLPSISKEFEEESFKTLEEEADEIIDSIKQILNNQTGGEVIEPRELLIHSKNTEDWTLVSSQYFYRFVDPATNERIYIELKSKPKNSVEKFMALYVLSLMDLVYEGVNNQCTVKLVLRPGNNRVSANPTPAQIKYGNKNSQSFLCDKARAEELLEKLHILIDNFSHNPAVPLSLAKSKVYSLYALDEGLFGQGGAWSYFNHSRLFLDKEKLGYDPFSFTAKDFIDELNKQIDLIEFLEPKLVGDDD